MIIPAPEARFLYLEGRLTKFALLDATDEEIQTITKLFKPAREDFLLIDSKEK